MIMPIKLPVNFEIGAAVPIDTRLVFQTKAQMKTVNDNIMPSVYLALCEETNAFYLYSKGNERDDNIGRFRYMFDQSGPTGGGVSEERVLELIEQNAASAEDMELAKEQLNAILDGAPEDCDTFAEVADKLANTPSQAISDDEINNIVTGG